MGFEAAIPIALEAAAEGQTRGARTGEDDMAGRISSALDLARQDGASAGMIAARTGTSVASRESVPAAFALLLHAGGDAWRAALAAANAGDDTDTIGAIAGAMGGACSGAQALPAERVAELRAANSLPVERVADALLAIRHRTEPGGGRRARRHDLPRSYSFPAWSST